MTKVVVILIFFLALNSANGAKILGIFHMPAPSHYILGSALMRALAEKGHDVTMISSFSEKEPPKGGNYTDVVLTGAMELMKERGSQSTMFDMFTKTPTIILQFILGHMGYSMTKFTLEHKNVQKLLKSDEKFDLVIVEQFMNDAFRAIPLHYKCPLIALSTVGANPWVNTLVANPAPSSYIPEIVSGGYSAKMNFWQRLRNAFIQVTNAMISDWYTIPNQKALAKEHFPNVDVEQIEKNVELVLLNSHPSLNQPVPTVPNMVNIGGYHVKPPKKLPKDLQDYLDSAKDGFIYFSMGSNLKSAELPDEKLNAILNNFKKLKFKILWKWENDILPGQPENVKLIKWAPQQDILAHPNIKLFITHGGLLSTTETIYHGVPILAIPVFADQYTNAQNAMNNGYGLALPFAELNEQTLEEKLNEILKNPKYLNVAKTRSRIFHDREAKPLDTAIYWVEYIIRHGGASHLKVEGINLPWYKLYLVDVIAFVIFAILALLKIASFVIRCVILLVKRTKDKKDNKKGNKKVKSN